MLKPLQSAEILGGDVELIFAEYLALFIVFDRLNNDILAGCQDKNIESHSWEYISKLM